MDLFTSGGVRWLGIQVGHEQEQQPRVLLVSVPYALKAGDAETLGGKPASAYMLSDSQSAGTLVSISPSIAGTVQSDASGKKTTKNGAGPLTVTPCLNMTGDGSAQANQIALYTNNPCALSEDATFVDVAGNIGIGTTTPSAKLSINSADGNTANLIYSGPPISGFTANTEGYVTPTQQYVFASLNSATAGNYAGLVQVMQDNGTANITGLYGEVEATNASGAKGFVNGMEGDAYLSGAGTATNLAGVIGYAQALPGAGTVNVMSSLYASSNARSAGTVSLNAGLYVGDQTGVANVAANNYEIYTANPAPFVVRADGKVGIGTTALFHSLDVAGDVNVNANYGGNVCNVLTVYLNGTPALGCDSAIVAAAHTVVGLTAVSDTGTPLRAYAGSGDTNPIAIFGYNATTMARIDITGKVFADGGFQTGDADFAESMAVRGSKSLYEPGILATPHTMDDGQIKQEVPLAVVGIVPCKVTAQNGPIREGDLLVTSSRPGYAMKGTDRRRLVGAVVGKALEPLATGTGTIEVLVTLQ